MSEELRDVGDPAPTPDGYPVGGFAGSSGSQSSLPTAVVGGTGIRVQVNGLNNYVHLDISRLVAIAADGAGGLWVPIWDKTSGTHYRANLDDLIADAGIPDAPVDGTLYARQDAAWVNVPAAPAPPDLTPYLLKSGGTMNGKLTLVTNSAGTAAIRFSAGATGPTSPSIGDMWMLSSDNLPRFRVGSNTRTFAFVETLPAPGIGEAPIDGSAYNRKDGAWVVDAGGGGGITDAPSNGTTYGRLNAAWSAVLPIAGGTLTGKLITIASATGAAGLNLPAGVAPTAPVAGDIWMTTGALFARINTTTYTVATLQQAQTFTVKQTFVAGSTAQASINLTPGVAPTTPVNGDMWTTATDLVARIGGSTYNSAWKNLDNAYTTKQTFMASGTGSASLRVSPGVAPTGPLDGDVWSTTAGGLFYRKNTVNRTVQFVEEATPTLVSDTAPAVGIAGTTWWDSDSGNFYVSNGTVWAMVAGPSVMPAFRGCRVYRTTTQSIPNGTLTDVLMDAESFDTDGFHSTVTNTNRLTIPAGVNYVEITAQADWVAVNTGERVLMILDQAGGIYGFVRYAPLTGAEAQVTTGPIPVVAGNWFTFQVYQTTGSALNTNTGIGRDWFSIQVLG